MTIINIKSVTKIQGLPNLAPNVTFNTLNCSFPYRCIVGEPSDEAQLRIENGGDTGTCAIAMQVGDETALIWSGGVNSGDGYILTFTVTFNKESYPTSQAIKVTFFCGYPLSETEMAVTDSIEFDTYLKVPTINWFPYVIAGGILVGVVIVGYEIMKTKKSPIRQPYYVQGR